MPGKLPGSPWYAIYTRSRHEKLVAQQLECKQIETFLPLCSEVHRWQDRYQKVEVPLFRGYVFAQFDHNSSARLAVLRSSGVVKIVGFGQEDAAIPAEQIVSLQRLMDTRAHMHPHHYLQVGQRVTVVSGALAGVEGILVKIKKQDRLVIAIEPIRQAISVELSGYQVVPIG